jgi:hypothetical protein
MSTHVASAAAGVGQTELDFSGLRPAGGRPAPASDGVRVLTDRRRELAAGPR